MGYGLPGVIGAYFANKKKLPICIVGDGGLMFNLQELQTAISYKIPLKLFIINNSGYLTMKLMQEKTLASSLALMTIVVLVYLHSLK